MKKKVIGAFLAVFASLTLHAQQIPGMDFDTWSKTGGSWFPYGKEAPASQRVWDSANKGLSLLGVNGTVPEYKHVAVAGTGKAAARIESKKVLWAFVAGNLYTGKFHKVVDFSGAEMTYGVPFTARPKSLSGYVDYRPGTVNYAKEPHLSMKGKQDLGSIEVILLDWDEAPRMTTNKGEFVDGVNDPHVVGRGVLELDRATGGYIHFDIPIVYRSGKTPKYAVFLVAASKYGAFFTGASGSTMYVDEFRFNY